MDNTLVQGEDGRYRIDFTDFEEKIRSCKVKLFFLCNPAQSGRTRVDKGGASAAGRHL